MADVSGPSYVHEYPEPMAHGRAIMQRDVVIDGRLVPELSGHVGSPAPWATVAAHEHKLVLSDGGAS